MSHNGRFNRHASVNRTSVVVLLAGVIVCASSSSILAQEQTAVELPGRRIYVPVEDLDVVLGRDKTGVMLPRAEFAELYAAAQKNTEDAATPPKGVILSAADYVAKIADDQLLITASITVTQLEPGWHAVPLRFEGLAVEQAKLGDAPAQLGRHPKSPHLVYLLNNHVGRQSLELQLSANLVSSGSDRMASFELLPVPAASFQLELPAGRYLELDGVRLERPAAEDQPAIYQAAVGGRPRLRLRITGKQAQQGDDALVFGSTGIGVRVTPEELTWQAVTEIRVFGKSIDRLTFSIPDTLQVVSIDSTGLEGWGFEPNEADQRTMLTLSYRQPFRDTRRITIRGVSATTTGMPWSVPNLTLSNATAHTSRVVVQHAPTLRLRADRLDGVRRIPDSGPVASEIRRVAATTNPETEHWHSSYFAAWQEDFDLAFVTQPKAREVQAAIATQLEAAARGLELRCSVTVEPRFAPLFGLDLTLPERWEIERIDAGGKQVPWRTASEENGIRAVRIPFDEPLPAGQSLPVSLFARWVPENWPIEEEPLEFPLPEIRLPQVDVLEGTYAIRSADDLRVTPLQLTGLDPSRDLESDPSRGHRLAYVYQDTRFAGELRITRRASRVSAATLCFARLDPETLHVHLEAAVNIDGGGLRELQLALPEATGEDLRFQLHNRNLGIVEQQPSSEIVDGERIWTLRFDQRHRGGLRLSVDLGMPREEAENFAVPDLRLIGAERQSGFTAIEGGSDQQLTLTANDFAGNRLLELAPEELPRPLNYQPRERIVAAYQNVRPGRQITLAETRFERLAVPTAICDQLSVESLLSEAGSLQHQATFTFRAVGVQALEINLPEEAALWSTLVDDQPVEVRRQGEAYRVPLPVSGDDQREHTLVLFYTNGTVPLDAAHRLTQEPPRLAVVSGAGDVQPLEILKQDWKIHHPPDTQFLSAHDLYQPEVKPAAPSLLGGLQQGLTIGSWTTLLQKLLTLSIALGVLCLLTLGYRKLGAPGAVGVGCVCLLIAGVYAIGTTDLGERLGGVAGKDAASTRDEAGLRSHRAITPASRTYYANTDPIVAAGESKNVDHQMPNMHEWKKLTDRRSGLIAGGRGEADQLGRPRRGSKNAGTAGGSITVQQDERLAESRSSVKGMPAKPLSGYPGPMQNRGGLGGGLGGGGTGGAAGLGGTAGDSGFKYHIGGPRPSDGGFGAQPQDRTMLGKQFRLDHNGDRQQKALADGGQLPAVQFDAGEGPEWLAPGQVIANEGAILADPGFKLGADVQQQGAVPPKLGGLLSLAVQLLPPKNSRTTTFRYVGAADASRGPKLQVDYLQSEKIPYVTLAWMMGALLVCWYLRNKLLSARAAVAVIGITGPLALASLAPPHWLSAIDGLFLGTLAGIGVWIAAPICQSLFSGGESWGGKLKSSIAARFAAMLLALMTVGLATDNLHAEDQPQKSAAVKTSKPVPPKSMPQPSVVIPYDAAGDPLAAERIFLPYEKFVELWNQAYPDKRIIAPAPVEAMIAEALYAAEVDAAAGPESAVIQVTGRVVAYSFRDRQVRLELPLGNVALDAVAVDGKSAAVQPNVTEQGTSYEILLQRPGLHVIDLKFRIPFERTGPAGRFSLPFKPVAAGALRFKLPAGDLKLRVGGGSGAYRRQQLAGDQLAVIPIDQGGNVAVSWQPQQTRAGVDGVIHTETASVLSVDDAGVNLTSTFSYRVRLGSMTDAIYALPQEVTVRQIRGQDLAGWEIEGEGANRRLRVFLRRKVEDKTELTFDLFLARQFTAEPQLLKLPDFAPQEVTRETGRIAVYAGDQFSVTSSVISSLAQIETKNLVLPVRYEHVDPKRQQPVAAYRYTTRPFQLQLLVRRQQPTLTGTAEHAAVIGSRKIRLHSQLELKLSGAPKSTITLKLPPDYLLLNAAADGLTDWSTTDAEGGDLLHLELANPRTGTLVVELSGAIHRTPDALQPTLQFPLATSADTLRSSAAIWLDPIYAGTMREIGNWRSVDPERLSSRLRGRIARPVQFAFSASGTQLPPIELSLERREARLAAAGLTTIIAKDTAVEYSLAFKWKISRAAAGRFVFTTPDWLSGKMDFAGNGYRRISESPTGENRTRWIVELDDPQRQEFFLVANVTLPPPEDGKIIAPPIRFENAKPVDDGSYAALETQNHYVILVNHSRDQLDQATADAVESTVAEEVRFINLPKSLLDQAVEILRVTDPETAVTWNVRKLEQLQALPASVNLAENTLVIARDGSWRAQARYRVNNRSRQFLALKLPQASRILSVYVAGRPSRPVETVKDGQAMILIALPKTLAGDFSFTADVVYSGRLPQALPQGLDARGRNFDLPHADVVSPKDDERFGIPVSKTSWTVYLPDDVDASVVDDPARTNLNVVPVSLQEYAYKDALLREAEELLSNLDRFKIQSGKYRARYNLRQIERQRQSLSRLENNSNTAIEIEKQAELERRNRSVQESIKKAYKQLEADSDQDERDQSGDLQVQGPQVRVDNTINTNEAISSELVAGNSLKSGAEGIEASIPLINQRIQPDSAGPSKAEQRAGKDASVQQRRSDLNKKAVSQQQALDAQAEQFKQKSGRLMIGVGINSDAEVAGEVPNEDDGEKQQSNPALQETGVLFGGRGEAAMFRLEPAEPQMLGAAGAPLGGESGQWTEAGGLSLLIEVPTAGQKLTLTKIGGAPKLAIQLRPQQFRDTLFSSLWLVIWGVLGLVIVLALRRPAAVEALLRLAPIALMVFGVICYLLIPFLSVVGFLVLMSGAAWLAYRHRRTAA